MINKGRLPKNNWKKNNYTFNNLMTETIIEIYYTYFQTFIELVYLVLKNVI